MRDKFFHALEASHNGDGPAPDCDQRPDEFVDYEVRPTPEDAEIMCSACPLLTLCRDSARRRKPAWGVWGGEVWVSKRRVHLLPADHEFLAESEEVSD